MLKEIAKLINQLAISIRINLNDGSITDWSKWLTFPSEGYGEVMRHGPFLVREVKYIEINSVEIRKLGRLLPNKEIDHSNELETYLKQYGIGFEKKGSIYKISVDYVETEPGSGQRGTLIR